ncbi:MAG: hypothetical protein ACRDY6_03710 [Acidimicrobiia bacterium]
MNVMVTRPFCWRPSGLSEPSGVLVGGDGLGLPEAGDLVGEVAATDEGDA